ATAIQTGSALLDEATGCSLRGGQARFDQQINYWYASRQAHLGNNGFWYRHTCTCHDTLRPGRALLPLEQRMGRVACLAGLVHTMRQLRDLKGQHLLGLTQFGAL